MKKRIYCIFIILLLILTTIPIVNYVNYKTEAKIQNPLNNSWLVKENNITILYQNGSHYEMGYQHGYLLKQEIEENYRAFLHLTDNEQYSAILERYNNITSKYIPAKYIEEMQGVSDGANISFDDVAVVNTGWYQIIDLGCADTAAWGSATSDGKLYHMRSWDITYNVVDPLTGKYLVENQILIVRKPDTGYASLQVSIAGFIENIGGFNEEGIAVSYDMSKTIDVNIESTPWSIRQKEVLDFASTSEQAIDILSINRTGGFNFIVSDSKIPTAFVCEFTSRFSYIGTWDDPVESNYPFWSIENVVRRKNFFIDRTTAITQRFLYNPKSIFHVINFNNYHFLNWKTYKSLSIELEKQWGYLNLNNTMEILQNVYCGKTDLFLFLSVNWFEGLQAYHQWVACPETGDMIISFGNKDNRAQFCDSYHFNLFDMLDS